MPIRCHLWSCFHLMYIIKCCKEHPEHSNLIPCSHLWRAFLWKESWSPRCIATWLGSQRTETPRLGVPFIVQCTGITIYKMTMAFSWRDCSLQTIPPVGRRSPPPCWGPGVMWSSGGSGVAQLVARSTLDRCVVGSSPTCGTEHFGFPPSAPRLGNQRPWYLLSRSNVPGAIDAFRPEL